MTNTVTIQVADLADSLGTYPEDIVLGLELAEKLGGAELRGGQVRLPAHAAERLGLVRDDDDGRWRAAPEDRDELAGKRKANHGPKRLREGLHADRKAREPWQELSASEEPPPDRIAILTAWFERWMAAPPVARAATTNSPALAPTPTPRPTRRVKPAPAPSSFSLTALRARLDTGKRVAV